MGLLDRLKAVGAEVIGRTDGGVRLSLPKHLVGGSNVAKEVTLPNHVLSGDDFGEVIKRIGPDAEADLGKVSAPDLKKTEGLGSVIRPDSKKSIAEQLMEKKQVEDQLAKFKEEGFEHAPKAPELIINEPVRRVGIEGVDQPSWQKGAEDIFNPTNKKLAGMAAGVGSQGFENPLSTMKEGYEGYKKLKDMLVEKVASNMNFGKDPTFQKVAEGTVGMAADPLSYVEGPAGIGLTALQAGLETMPEDKFKKTKKMFEGR